MKLPLYKLKDNSNDHTKTTSIAVLCIRDLVSRVFRTEREGEERPLKRVG